MLNGTKLQKYSWFKSHKVIYFLLLCVNMNSWRYPWINWHHCCSQKWSQPSQWIYGMKPSCAVSHVKMELYLTLQRTSLISMLMWQIMDLPIAYIRILESNVLVWVRTTEATVGTEWLHTFFCPVFPQHSTLGQEHQDRHVTQQITLPDDADRKSPKQRIQTPSQHPLRFQRCKHKLQLNSSTNITRKCACMVIYTTFIKEVLKVPDTQY
jgi:hypothetical protein